MSASLWPGKIGGSCLSLLIGMQHPQSLETTFVCKVHCSQPGSQTVWQKFANDCCHIYKCMLQSVSLHQSNLSATGLFQTEDLTQFVVYWFCCKIVAKYLCNFAVKLLSWNNYHTVYGGIFPFLFRSTRFWLISECKPLKV